MPAEAQGSLYATSSGCGIRWLENGRRRFRSGFETKRDARRWFEDEVRPRLRGRKRESSTSTLAEFVETRTRRTSSPERSRRCAIAWRTRSRGSATFRSPTSKVRRSRSRHGELRFPASAQPGYVGAQAGARRCGCVGVDRREPAKKAGRNPQPKAREIRPLTVEELGCGHLSGIHDHACKARGCRCEKFERFASFPVPYVLRHTFASNGACRGRRDVPARKGHGNLARDDRAHLRAPGTRCRRRVSIALGRIRRGSR